MTKTFFSTLLMLTISFLASGQMSTDTLFTLTYKPSFHNPSRLTVYKNNTGFKGLFQTTSLSEGKVRFDTTIAMLSSETYNSYVSFFSSYKFPGYIDNKIPDTTQNYVQGKDGITIMGIYNGDTKKLFRFWSPYRDKESMTLFKMTLNDLDKSFKTKDTKKYLKTLRMYSK